MHKPPVCDFCMGTPIQWTYPCRNFTHHGLEVTFKSSGGWAACSICHDLIERQDRSALAQRSAVCHPDRRNIPLALLTRRVRSLHDTFWVNREGPPVQDDGSQGDPTRPEDNAT